MSFYLGFDVGGTKCSVVIGDEAGAVHAEETWPSGPERGWRAMVGDLVTQAQPLVERWRPVGAGVSIGGPLDSEKGIIYSPPNLPGWDGVALKAELEAALGIPVTVEHDGAACALAEYRWGVGSGSRRLAYLTCGTGFGLGLVFDGAIYRGAGGNPPDFGHLRYRDEGPIAYGRQGTYEAYAAGSAIGRLATWRNPSRWPAETTKSPEVARLALAGDAEALEILHLNADAVGTACALLADTLYPDTILLGSLATYLGEPWLARVRSTFEAEAYPRAREVCQIQPGGLGPRLQQCSAFVPAIR